MPSQKSDKRETAHREVTKRTNRKTKPTRGQDDPNYSPRIIWVCVGSSVAVVAATLAYGMYTGDDKLMLTALAFAAKALFDGFRSGKR